VPGLRSGTGRPPCSRRSATGVPSLNVPCGFDDAGLPTGMQVIGRPFGEADLLGAGQAFQSATNFHTKIPPLAR
jgi:aspartyl-tRNA(Asn)/glutamyl-tRNA(Gln) amidotransferase subunit A